MKPSPRIPAWNGRRFFDEAVLAAILCSLGSPAHGLEPVVTKIHAPNAAASVEGRFGESIAMNDRWILVGEAENDGTAEDSGAVHVLDARTGRFLRTLVSPDPNAGELFGHDVAIQGRTALIGALEDDELGAQAGAAFLFDIPSGVLIRKLTAADGGPDQLFGFSVALGVDHVAIGAPGGQRVRRELRCGLRLRHRDRDPAAQVDRERRGGHPPLWHVGQYRRTHPGIRGSAGGWRPPDCKPCFRLTGSRATRWSTGCSTALPEDRP